jgi:dTDP-4-amino-4,6-dideoxygalactose transaminase
MRTDGCTATTSGRTRWGRSPCLEEEFAAFTGAKYCVAVASGGYAMSCALRALGVGPGDKVLSNGFTLAPVPGAIASVGAEPVFVETTEALTIDIDDLAGEGAAERRGRAAAQPHAGAYLRHGPADGGLRRLGCG